MKSTLGLTDVDAIYKLFLVIYSILTLMEMVKCLVLLVRVLFEAIGDTAAGVPGVSNSTGVAVKGLIDFQAIKSKPNAVSDEQFAVTERVSKSVEGVVSSAIGRFSLNNESLATIIETMVGVSLKKATEKVCWCYFKAKNASGGSNVLTLSDVHPVKINLIIRGTSPVTLGQKL